MASKDTQFKKGERKSIKTEFIKGFSPWNKGIFTTPMKKCTVCAIEFRGIGVKFCSLKCNGISSKELIRSEMTREKMSFAKKGVKLSEEHKSKLGLKGELNPNWKGGSSKCYKTGYYSSNYKKWRAEVFKRDGYSCRDCGSCGYITAHHIKSFAKFPELRYELSNGLTLCEKCHSETDNYKGRANKKIITLRI